jgi:hypothetical protein
MCSEPRLLDVLQIGDRISLDDDTLQGSVVEEAQCGYLVRINKGKLKGMKLKPGKGFEFLRYQGRP